MRVVAEACRTAGGSVTGVIPESLVEAEVDRDVDDLRIVGTMHERKALMGELAAGFVALPGGFGTFEEFCEVVTWSQLGLHVPAKPCALLDVDRFYSPLLELFDRGVGEGFIRPEHRRLVLAAPIRSASWTYWRPGNRRRRPASGSTIRWRPTAIRPEPQPEARNSSGASGRLRATVKAASSATAPTVAQRGNRRVPAGRPTSGRSQSASATPRIARNPGRSRLWSSACPTWPSTGRACPGDPAGGAVDAEQQAARAQRVDPRPEGRPRRRRRRPRRRRQGSPNAPPPCIDGQSSVGAHGRWARRHLDRPARPAAGGEARAAAAELEELGFGALWIPEAVGGAISHAAVLLDATERLVVATGVAVTFSRLPSIAVAAQRLLADDSGGRFLLGLGVSHAAMIEGMLGQVWDKPVSHARDYLDAMDDAFTVSPPPADDPPRVLAALGPKMLEPRQPGREVRPTSSRWSTPPRRRGTWDGPMLLVEQAVVLESDADVARAIGRKHMSIYLTLPNYVNNLRRLGWATTTSPEGAATGWSAPSVAWETPTPSRRWPPTATPGPTTCASRCSGPTPPHSARAVAGAGGTLIAR